MKRLNDSGEVNTVKVSDVVGNSGVTNDICLDPETNIAMTRLAVRINQNAANQSGVEVVSTDTGGVTCG